MNTILASIVFISSLHSLDELEAVVGIEAGAGSHNKCDPWGKRGVWPHSILRMESELLEGESAGLHVDHLLAKFESLGIQARLSGAEGLRVTMDIAVTFLTAYASVTLDESQVLRIGRNGMALEMTAYPTVEDDDADVDVEKKDY